MLQPYWRTRYLGLPLLYPYLMSMTASSEPVAGTAAYLLSRHGNSDDSNKGTSSGTSFNPQIDALGHIHGPRPRKPQHSQITDVTKSEPHHHLSLPTDGGATTTPTALSR